MGIDGTLDGTIGDGSRVDSGKGGNGLLIRDVLSRMYILTESPILWTLLNCTDASNVGVAWPGKFRVQI